MSDTLRKTYTFYRGYRVNCIQPNKGYQSVVVQIENQNPGAKAYQSIEFRAANELQAGIEACRWIDNEVLFQQVLRKEPNP